MSVDHLAFAARAISAGAGLALLPIPLVRGFARIGPLDVVLPGYKVGGAGLSVVLPSSAFVPARVALLRDFLVSRLSDEINRANKACESRHHAAKPVAKAKEKKR